MMAMTTKVSAGSPFTVRDLEAFPDDGRRYELIDGTLFVSPVPGRLHQTVVGELLVILNTACPPEFDVIAGPFAVQPSDITQLQPDVVVGLVEDFTEENLPVAPQLVVEVLTPNTALHDWHNKKAVYARMGARIYWIVDPIAVELTVFELTDESEYELVAKVSGDEAFQAETPYPVTVVPRTLLGQLA